MEWWCPVCNGAKELDSLCPHCDSRMVDGGRISDYFGPYSPYDAIDASDLQGGRCIHVIYCPSCGWDDVREITVNPGEC